MQSFQIRFMIIVLHYLKTHWKYGHIDQNEFCVECRDLIDDLKKEL